MKNLKNWLNKNKFKFEISKNNEGDEIIFIYIQEILGTENLKRIKSYLKRYKFNFEYRGNYTSILIKNELETVQNNSLENEGKEEVTKENKINDLLVEKANNLIESLDIEKDSDARVYLNYAKENGIKTNDKMLIQNMLLCCKSYNILRIKDF